MRKSCSPASHPYSDRTAFERLMLLIATLVQHPGVGSAERVERVSEKHHDALVEVQQRLQEVAGKQGISLTACSLPTLRKDLGVLRRWGILEQHMYRWGYYLGTGAMNREELQVALNALYSQARYQRDPEVTKLYERLERRLRGLHLSEQLFYPVRTHIDRAVVYTDPEEMMAQRQYRGTLFEKLEALEESIIQGQAIELFRSRNPYRTGETRYMQVYPLQLVYADIAWYLLHEDCESGHLALSRLDRLSDHFQPIEGKQQNTEQQWQSLQMAHRLLETGWGLFLGTTEEQRLEKLGQLEPVEVTVRFFPEVMSFILEGEKRHPAQKIHAGPKGKDGRLEYLDYTVKLPRRSLNEFCYWVCRFMGNTQFISPPELIEKHKQMAQELLTRYTSLIPSQN
ncbi:MAG: WYL domain-containing protein [Synechococcales cyanobacterium C42_A2020_086]|nr:WYL domain-containing protein [Synechococcales cyanobacterium C42_A2020_086]